MWRDFYSRFSGHFCARHALSQAAGQAPSGAVFHVSEFRAGGSFHRLRRTVRASGHRCLLTPEAVAARNGCLVRTVSGRVSRGHVSELAGRCPSDYVSEDDHGVMRVGETRVMFDSVVAAFDQGHSAETIAQQYTSLTLEEVYGAIAYYLAHKQEVDQYMRRQAQVWNQWREKANKTVNPAVQRLRDQAAKAGMESR